MGKFTNDSKLLLEYVGGKENINAVSHCVTRMLLCAGGSIKSRRRKNRIHSKC